MTLVTAAKQFVFDTIDDLECHRKKGGRAILPSALYTPKAVKDTSRGDTPARAVVLSATS